MILLFYTGTSAFNSFKFPTSGEHRNIVQLCTSQQAHIVAGQKPHISLSMWRYMIHEQSDQFLDLNNFSNRISKSMGYRTAIKEQSNRQGFKRPKIHDGT